MNHSISKNYNAVDEVVSEIASNNNSNGSLGQTFDRQTKAVFTNETKSYLNGNSALNDIFTKKDSTAISSSPKVFSKIVNGSSLNDILSPTNVAPLQASIDKDTPIEEVVFAFDQLTQTNNNIEKVCKMLLSVLKLYIFQTSTLINFLKFDILLVVKNINILNILNLI